MSAKNERNTKQDDESNSKKSKMPPTIEQVLELAKISPSRTLDYSNITKMDLPNCGLSELPAEFATTFPQLSIIFLSNNQFREMPAIIGDCPNLQMVAFRGNGMTSIHPDALQSQLRWCILTNNSLTTIPDTIGRCTSLEKIMFSGNQITALPASIGNCPHLKMVRISSNKMTEFPSVLLKCPQLKWIACSDNPFCANIQGPSSNKSLPMLDASLDSPEGEILGQGGGGITRKLMYDDAYVAVKQYHGAMTADGMPEEERRILSLVAGLVESDCLIRIIGETPQGALVMEFLDQFEAFGGRPNFETCWYDVYPDDFKVTPVDANAFLTGMLDALTKLHKIGIVHGDFYGHNILVKKGCISNVRLTDFGGAWCYDPKASYAPDLERIELRSYQVLVNECAERLMEDPDRIMEAKLRKLAEHCVTSDASFSRVLEWWKSNNQESA